MKLNKTAGALLAVVLCNASTLFGAEDKMVSVKPNGCKGPVLCPTFSILDDKGPCCHTWHVDVGLLYQQPGFSGMTSGINYLGVFENTSAATFEEQTITTLNECFPYTLGLTVSLGYLMPHDDWFLLAKFDWLSANTSINHSGQNDHYAPNPHFNFDVMTGTSWDPDTNSFSSIDYAAKLDIYALDVVLTRGSFHSSCYSLEPYVGVKALWYSSNQIMDYYSTEGGLTRQNLPSLTVSLDNWGAGPMFGFQGEYHLTHGLSFFSDSDVGVICGSSTNSYVSNLTPDGSVIDYVQTINNNISSNGCQFYLPVRSIIGVKLSQYCLNDAHFIAVKLGYDARIVLSSPLLLSTNGVVGSSVGAAATVSTPVPSDLFMSGLYVNFEWNF